MNDHVVKIGADIEGFVKDGNEIIPCVGLIPGTKEEPYRPRHDELDVPLYAEGFAVQEDNVLLEYNVPPATTAREMQANLQIAQDMIREVLRGAGRRLSFVCKTEHRFKPHHLESEQARMFACQPDRDAYSGGDTRQMPRKVTTELGCNRSAGGHMHLQVKPNCPTFVAVLMLEAALGPAYGILQPSGSSRPAWYGKPGIYRDKPYGFEYRTPDNAWTNTDSVDSYNAPLVALATAEYLQNSTAKMIHMVFDDINWMEVNEYMLPLTSTVRRFEIAERVRAVMARNGFPTDIPLRG